MNSVVRVLIGDDHRIVREGLKQVLGDPANGAPEITVVAEATQGSEVLEQVTALQGRTGAPGLDLVLLDIAMPVSYTHLDVYKRQLPGRAGRDGQVRAEWLGL